MEDKKLRGQAPRFLGMGDDFNPTTPEQRAALLKMWEEAKPKFNHIPFRGELVYGTGGQIEFLKSDAGRFFITYHEIKIDEYGVFTDTKQKED